MCQILADLTHSSQLNAAVIKGARSFTFVRMEKPLGESKVYLLPPDYPHHTEQTRLAPLRMRVLPWKTRRSGLACLGAARFLLREKGDRMSRICRRVSS
jgi:hypothetical protein